MEPNTFIITRVSHFDGIRVTETDYFQVTGKSAKSYSDTLTTAINKFRYWVIVGSPDLPLSDDGWVELQGYRDEEPTSGVVANNVGPDLTYTEVLDTWYEIDCQPSWKIAEVRESA